MWGFEGLAGWRLALRVGALLALGLALLGLAADGVVEADVGTKAFSGAGVGSSEVVNGEECESVGRCVVEFVGEFDAGEMGAGVVRFRFVDDWSGVSGGLGSCSVPIEGGNSFIWESEDGDGLVMAQTLGFACPSATGEVEYWKRALRIVEGTGRFDGVSGSVFISGSRMSATGEEVWTFEGSVRFPRERRDGCYRAYFLGDLMVIPPRGVDPPFAPTLSFWLCGDGVTLQWPNPRAGYEVFNPLE